MPSPSTSSASPIADARLKRAWEKGVFIGFLLWTYVSLCYPLRDTDFWWHLKTGEWIVEHGFSVPQVDLYTFTEVTTPWIDLHWGFQLLITLLYHLGGANLVILVKAAIITAAVGVAWAAAGRSVPVWAKAALWILPVICIAFRGYERPEMLSQLFLAMWLWMARRVEERPKLVWLLPLLQLVWVNCHALFVLGLVVGACYVVDCLARDAAQGRWGLEPPVPQPSARTLIRVGALVVLACLANPYFDEGALFPLTLYRKFTVDQDFYSFYIGEFHRPIDVIRQYGWRAAANVFLLAEAGVFCIAAASFVWLIVRRRRWSVLRLLLFIGFSHLAWEAIRNINIFALVAGVVACENFGEAIAVDQPASPPRKRLTLLRGMAVILAVLIAAVVSGQWNAFAGGDRPFGLGEAPRWFIHDAARFAGREGFPRRAFVANNGQAAVYIYHNWPERRVFMDARLEVCGRKTFEEFNEILRNMATGNIRAAPLFQQDEVEPPVVILDSRNSRDQINGMLQTPGWRLVFADHAAAVFLTDEQADRLSLPKVDHQPLLYPDGPPDK